MGIQGLSKVIGDHAPKAVKEFGMESLHGRTIAIDASMSIYQFLIAVRGDGGQVLVNEEGETTSHLMGMLYRTVRMLTNGIKPVYVFDGKPPQMKSGELEKRTERRGEAEKSLQQAKDEGNVADVDKFSRRLVKVTKEHVDDCRRLLKLMGVPFIDAPCEAESQCAELVKAGTIYATATEDMDALTFGTNVLLRHMTFSEARKMPIKEYRLEAVLAGLEMDMAQFVDLCILLGCDYCPSIRGIGPKRAYELVKQHGTIENIVEAIKNDKGCKYEVPEGWLFAEARKLFHQPDVTDGKEFQIEWSAPDEEAIVDFMVKEKGFNEERMRAAVQKLKKARTAGTQMRMENFFKSTGNISTTTTSSKTTSDKKKRPNASGGPAKKGGKFVKK